MNDNQWKVAINSLDHAFISKVYIYRKIGDRVHYLKFDDKNNMILVTEKYTPGTEIQPSFSGNTEEIMSIAKGFVAWANEQGFKNSDETFSRGKLEATELHLQDMRRMVFDESVKPNDK